MLDPRKRRFNLKRKIRPQTREWLKLIERDRRRHKRMRIEASLRPKNEPWYGEFEELWAKAPSTLQYSWFYGHEEKENEWADVNKRIKKKRRINGDESSPGDQSETSADTSPNYLYSPNEGEKSSETKNTKAINSTDNFRDPSFFPSSPPRLNNCPSQNPSHILPHSNNTTTTITQQSNNNNNSYYNNPNVGVNLNSLNLFPNSNLQPNHYNNYSMNAFHNPNTNSTAHPGLNNYGFNPGNINPLGNPDAGFNNALMNNHFTNFNTNHPFLNNLGNCVNFFMGKLQQPPQQLQPPQSQLQQHFANHQFNALQNGGCNNIFGNHNPLNYNHFNNTNSNSYNNFNATPDFFSHNQDNYNSLATNESSNNNGSYGYDINDYNSGCNRYEGDYNNSGTTTNQEKSKKQRTNDTQSQYNRANKNPRANNSNGNRQNKCNNRKNRNNAGKSQPKTHK